MRNRNGLGELPRHAQQDVGVLPVTSVHTKQELRELPVFARRGSYRLIQQTVSNAESAQILIKNTRRCFLSIQNQDALNSIFINYDIQATLASFAIQGGETLLLDVPPVNSIYAIAAVAPVTVLIMEGTDV